MHDISNREYDIKNETELSFQKKGFVPLDAEQIMSQIVGKTFLGGFPPSFKYIISINKDGTLEGKNNHQHYDKGQWLINAEQNTLSVTWDYGWENTSNHVYLVNNIVHMFDATSGKLNTYFDEIVEGVQSIKKFDI